MEPTGLAWRPNRGVCICICICIWRPNSRDVRRCSRQGDDGDRCLITSVRRERTNPYWRAGYWEVGGKRGSSFRDRREGQLAAAAVEGGVGWS